MCEEWLMICCQLYKFGTLYQNTMLISHDSAALFQNIILNSLVLRKEYDSLTLKTKFSIQANGKRNDAQYVVGLKNLHEKCVYSPNV